MNLLARNKAEPKVDMSGSNITLAIMRNCALQIEAIIESTNEEVGWLSKIINYNGTYVMTDVFLPAQEANTGTCEIDPGAINEHAHKLFTSEMEKHGDIDKAMEAIEGWVGWGHSHINGGVFPSSQDVKQFAEMIDEKPVYFRMIGNKKGEMKVDAYFTELGLQLNDIPWFIYDDTKAKILKDTKKRVEEVVKKKTYRQVSMATTVGASAVTTNSSKKKVAEEAETTSTDKVSLSKFKAYAFKHMPKLELDFKNTCFKDLAELINEYSLSQLMEIFGAEFISPITGKREAQMWASNKVINDDSYKLVVELISIFEEWAIEEGVF